MEEVLQHQLGKTVVLPFITIDLYEKQKVMVKQKGMKRIGSHMVKLIVKLLIIPMRKLLMMVASEMLGNISHRFS